MRLAPFRHIGGQVITDHGPLSLGHAQRTAAFYREEEARCPANGAWTRACGARAAALVRACQEARAWRRAAGWTDPEAADISPRDDAS